MLKKQVLEPKKHSNNSANSGWGEGTEDSVEKEEIEESNREQSPTTQTRSIKATKKVRMAGWGGGQVKRKGAPLCFQQAQVS